MEGRVISSCFRPIKVIIMSLLRHVISSWIIEIDCGSQHSVSEDFCALVWKSWSCLEPYKVWAPSLDSMIDNSSAGSNTATNHVQLESQPCSFWSLKYIWQVIINSLFQILEYFIFLYRVRYTWHSILEPNKVVPKLCRFDLGSSY